MKDAAGNQVKIDINDMIPPEDYHIILGDLGCVVMNLTTYRELVLKTGDTNLMEQVKNSIRAMQGAENPEATEGSKDE